MLIVYGPTWTDTDGTRLIVDLHDQSGRSLDQLATSRSRSSTTTIVATMADVKDTAIQEGNPPPYLPSSPIPLPSLPIMHTHSVRQSPLRQRPLDLALARLRLSHILQAHLDQDRRRLDRGPRPGVVRRQGFVRLCEGKVSERRTEFQRKVRPRHLYRIQRSVIFPLSTPNNSLTGS